MSEEKEQSPWTPAGILTEYQDIFQEDGHLQSRLKLDIDPIVHETTKTQNFTNSVEALRK